MKRRFVHLFCLLVLLCAKATFASPDTIIPKPKQIKLSGRELPLTSMRIVLVTDEKKLRIGADEINARLADLGAKPLPVLAGADRIGPNAIVLLHAGSRAGRRVAASFRIDVSAQKPGEQGYVIASRRTDRGTRVFLAGSDAQGALYAAVTLRYLIERRPAGPVLLEAEVVDWPDFKWRQMGVPFAIPLRQPWYDLKAAAARGNRDRMQQAERRYFETEKQYIDWLLRHKINLMSPQPAGWAARPESLTPFLRAAIRRVNQYALDRGIGTFYNASICIGTYPKDKDNPDFKDVVFYRGHKRYFCWSRLDYHRRKARRIAEMMRDCAYTGFYLHDVDGGGWKDPAMWSKRCERCRKMYGDDHAAADKAVFGTYYDEIKRLVPNVKFVAVIYPYSPSYLNPDWLEDQIRSESGDLPGIRQMAERLARKNWNFLKRVGELLPPDIYICIRENTRPNIDLIRKVYGRRPFYLYYEYAYWKGWRPCFITTPRWTKTFLYPGIDDILYGNNSLYDYNMLTQLYGVECSWNTEGPGRELFPSKAAWRDPRQCLEPKEVAEAFAKRACRDFWGDEAAPYLVPFFMGNLSVWFIRDPDAVARKCGLTNVAELMRGQAQAAERATRSLAALWQKVVAASKQHRRIMSDYAYPYFVDFYKLALGARIVANYKAQRLEAERAVIAGDLDRAERIVAETRRELDRDAAELARVRAELKREPSFASAYSKRDPFGALFHLDVSELRKDLDRFDAQRQAMFESFNIPRWFRKIMEQRSFTAARTRGPIRVDGRLDEPAWAQTPVIEHFVNYRRLQLASLETRVRVLYDDRFLYVGFECADPRASELHIAPRERDAHELVDSVEVFVDPNRTRKAFFHWIVDAGGNLFDAARRRGPDGVWKYSTEFNSRCKFKVRIDRDRWWVEMAIPFAELGARPRRGRPWGFNVCRNIVHTHPDGKAECVTAGFLGGGNFHTVERYPTLNFAPAPVPPQPADVRITVRNAMFRPITTGEGGGVEATFDMWVETTSALHDVDVEAVAWVGDRRVGTFTIARKPVVQLLWRSLRPVTLTVKEIVPGLEVVFVVRAREGEWRARYVFGRPPRRKAAAPRFVPGVDGRGQALASLACFPAVHFDNGRKLWLIRPEAGTIEFWVRPHWDARQPASPLRWMRHIFLDMGPVRYDYPFLTNYRTIAIGECDTGTLVFILTNRNYKARTTSAMVRGWKRGEWHHVACQWRIRDGRCDMQIYVDGRKASGKVAGHEVKRYVKEEEAFLIQLGAMNTGVLPADADIDELRISDRPRYRGAFTPAKRPAVDSATLILFRFDGNLRGECPGGRTIVARPGTAG